MGTELTTIQGVLAEDAKAFVWRKNVGITYVMKVYPDTLPSLYQGPPLEIIWHRPKRTMIDVHHYPLKQGNTVTAKGKYANKQKNDSTISVQFKATDVHRKESNNHDNRFC